MVAIAKSFSLDVCVTLKQPMCLVVKGTTACYLVNELCNISTKIFNVFLSRSFFSGGRKEKGKWGGFGFWVVIW